PRLRLPQPRPPPTTVATASSGSGGIAGSSPGNPELKRRTGRSAERHQLALRTLDTACIHCPTSPHSAAGMRYARPSLRPMVIVLRAPVDDARCAVLRYL